MLMDAHLFIEAMKWTGTGMFALGSTAISVSPRFAGKLWPFVVFLVGHAMWASAGHLMNDSAVTALNLMYIPLDMYAISVRARVLMKEKA